MRCLSLRRSLCSLLVVATAFSSFADLSSSQLQNLLNSIGAVYDILNQTQNNQGLSTAWYLQNIRDIIRNPMSDLQASAQSQSASLTSLLSELQAVRTAVESESSGFDDTDLLNGLNSVQSSLQTMQGYLASLDASVSALSSTNDASGLDLQGYFSQVIDALTNLQAVFDGSINVTGELTLGDGQASMIRNISLHTQGTQNAVSTLTQHLDNFIGSPGDSLADLNPGGNGAMSWHAFLEGFVDMYQLLEQQFEILGYRLLLLTQYAQRMDEDYMPSITNSLMMYLPFLTNQSDDAFFIWFTNQVIHIPGYASSSSWNDNADEYRLARVIGMLLAQNYGLTGSKEMPSRTSILQVPGAAKSFFTSGTVSPTQIESLLYSWSEPLLNQRRWMYEISNTVPYIEGLPTRKAALSESGNGWLSAWGDYQWSTDGGTISLIEDGRTRAHTPWNQGYFSTDYFADLLKFIARTNLLQESGLLSNMMQLMTTAEDIPSNPNEEGYNDPNKDDNIEDEVQNPDDFVDSITLPSAYAPDADEKLDEIRTGLQSAVANPVLSKDPKILLFPSVSGIFSLNNNVEIDVGESFTAEDRKEVRDLMTIIWHIVGYTMCFYILIEGFKTLGKIS